MLSQLASYDVARVTLFTWPYFQHKGATDSTVPMKGKHHVDYVSQQAASYRGQTQPRITALRPRPVEVYLGGNSLNYATSHEDLNDKVAAFKVGPGRYCLPRPPCHVHPRILASLVGIL